MLKLPEKLFKQAQKKYLNEIQSEYESERLVLRSRDDFSRELEHFIETLSLYTYPERFTQRFSRPIAGFYCVPVPLELLDAFGYHPVRFCRGSASLQKISSFNLPALSCPLIKSCLGSFYLEESLEKKAKLLIISHTCDWMVRFPEISSQTPGLFYTLDLPHIRETDRSRKRWQEEVFALKRHLEFLSGKKLSRKKLSDSILKYTNAWKLFNQVIDLRRRGLIPGVWFTLIANSFMIDDVGSWARQIELFLKKYPDGTRKQTGPRVFLSGSPLVFPNLKLAGLIEDAGMYIAADNLCTSEKLYNALSCDDLSDYGLLKALAEGCQLPCSCPTFSVNETRIENTLALMKDFDIQGLIHCVLKGCHPFDIESFILEKRIKESGYRFIKIETDYSREDKEVILTRLEAFKQTF